MKLKLAAIVSIIAVVAGINLAYAATTSQTKDVSAFVDEQLILDIKIFRGAVLPANEVTTMDYGTLVRESFGGVPAALRSSSYFTVLMGINTSKRRYQVTQNGSALTVTGTANTLPQGAYVCVPNNNGNTSLPGSLGSAGTAVGTRTIYTSNLAGDGAVFAAAYSLTNDPAQAGAVSTNFIPPDQPTGTYTGTVVYTLSTL